MAEVYPPVRHRPALLGARSRAWRINQRTRMGRVAFAWAWKLASLGVPVVLVYLGFLNAGEMKDRGEPLSDARHWQNIVQNHSESVVPVSVWVEPVLINCTPLHALIRSTEIALSQASS